MADGDFEVTIRSLSGEETKISFSLQQAITAMQAWERLKDGDPHVSGAQLAIWLQDKTNLLTMVSIMEKVKELDDK